MNHRNKEVEDNRDMRLSSAKGSMSQNPSITFLGSTTEKLNLNTWMVFSKKSD